MIMPKYKIELDREACIGAAVCAAIAPQFWKMVDDGKVNLIGGQKNKDTGMWELIIESENDLMLNKESAESCPVTVIHITNLDTNQKLI